MYFTIFTNCYVMSCACAGKAFISFEIKYMLELSAKKKKKKISYKAYNYFYD